MTIFCCLLYMFFEVFFRSILWSCFYYGILLNPKSRAHFCSDWVYSNFAVIFLLIHYLMFSLRPSTIWLRSCLMACRLVSVSKRTWYGGRYMVREVSHIICLFVLVFYVPLENFSLLWLGHHLRWRDPNFYLNKALMAFEQWRSFCVPHLLWQGTSAYVTFLN